MELTGAKIAVLVENYYQELEVWYPLLRCREAGADAFTVAAEAGQTYKSKLGYPVVADRSIDSVRSEDLDAVVIPGGWAPDFLRQDERMVGLVRQMDRQGKVVASICHAGWMLCSARILKGRRATSYKSIRDDMINAGADYRDEEVVVDGNLITSRTPQDLPAFCREILRLVSSSKKASRQASEVGAKS